jgi:WD40 repeat protein
VKVWDAQTGQEALSLRGHTNQVFSAAFSPDGQRLASGSLDKTVKVWDALNDQEPLVLKGHTGEVRSVTFSPDGQRLASASRDKTVMIWDVPSGQQVLTLEGHKHPIASVAFRGDGHHLCSVAQGQHGNLEVQIWDAQAGQGISTLMDSFGVVQEDKQPYCVALSPDGQHLAGLGFGDRNLQFKIWDVQSFRETLVLKGGRKPLARCLAFSPDGKWLAGYSVPASSDNRTIEGELTLWDAKTGQEIRTLQGHADWVTSAAFSLDGQHLAGAGGEPGMPGQVRVWDTRTGKEILNLQGLTGWVYNVAFSPDGHRLAGALGGTGEVKGWGEVKVWDVQSGQETFTFQGHTGPVLSVAFSSDGQRLASASADRTVKVWETIAPTVQEVAQRRASHLVHELFAELDSKADVLNRLRQDTHLGSSMRALALAYAERLSPAPGRLNDLSWDVVRQPGLAASSYQRALHQAREACRLVPSNGSYLTTLGVALYRAREYKEAVKTLSRSDKQEQGTLESSIPAELAFLVMAHHSLGQEEQAQARLTQLRETMKKPQWAANAEAKGFLREAEALLQGPAAKPKR